MGNCDMSVGNHHRPVGGHHHRRPGGPGQRQGEGVTSGQGPPPPPQGYNPFVQQVSAPAQQPGIQGYNRDQQFTGPGGWYAQA